MTFASFLVVIPAVIFAMYAQSKIRRTYQQYKQVNNEKGLTGFQAARHLLEINGLRDVGVEEVAGELSDHYDPRERVVRLSRDNYYGQSLAALGVAAHEVGHAIQHKVGYGPLNLRHTLLPVTSLGSSLAFPLFMAGFFFQATSLMTLGIVFFATVLAFHVVTLPVEFDASNRAIRQLAGTGMLADREAMGARKVLNAAALTYVAATAMAAMQLLQMVLLRGDD